MFKGCLQNSHDVPIIGTHVLAMYIFTSFRYTSVRVRRNGWNVQFIIRAVYIRLFAINVPGKLNVVGGGDIIKLTGRCNNLLYVYIYIIYTNPISAERRRITSYRLCPGTPRYLHRASGKNG